MKLVLLVVSFIGVLSFVGGQDFTGSFKESDSRDTDTGQIFLSGSEKSDYIGEEDQQFEIRISTEKRNYMFATDGTHGSDSLDGIVQEELSNETKQSGEQDLFKHAGSQDQDNSNKSETEVHQKLEHAPLIIKGKQETNVEERKILSKRKLRRWSRCKARNACVVMGGSCVTNVTLCSGRLVPEGCKGINCQCCVPGIAQNKDIRSMECPEGFFMGPTPSYQCLKFINNTKRNGRI